MSKIAIIYHTGYGHTGVVAEHVARGVSDAGVEATLLKIESPTQDFTDILAAAATSDGIIFGAPTYMGDVSVGLKAFFEASSKAWYGGEWKDKVAAGFTNSFNVAGDKAHALNSIFTLAMQHGMIWAGTGIPSGSLGKPVVDTSVEIVNRFGYNIGLATQADNGPADQTPGAGDLEFARQFGERVGRVTAKLANT
jgi:NAD(P)H dehydrogenase (quinone)